MNCTKASVNKAIHNLKDNNLINYETYGKIELTDQGTDLAKKILEAYDISYVFFKDVIGLDEDTSKREAEKYRKCGSCRVCSERQDMGHWTVHVRP